MLDDDLAYAASAYRELQRQALDLAGAGPLTPAALRDATGTSRKYVMAILEDLGRRGVLRRTPDGHVPARAPASRSGRERRRAVERVSGIVLAGGASRRFGTDKLAVTVDGRSMLERAVASVAAVSAEVIVVVAPGDDRPLPRRRGRGAGPPSRGPETHGGPLVGLLAGLEAAREPIAVVAGGDMPTLSVDVLHALVRALVAAEGHGRRRRSSSATGWIGRCRRPSATEPRRRPRGALLGEGERSLVALFRTLSTQRIAEADWRGLDPGGETLRDVDTPADLRPGYGARPGQTKTPAGSGGRVRWEGGQRELVGGQLR